MHEYGVRLCAWSELPRADAIVAAVSHRELLALAVEDFQKKGVKGGCLALIGVKSRLQLPASNTIGYQVRNQLFVKRCYPRTIVQRGTHRRHHSRCPAHFYQLANSRVLPFGVGSGL